ncbi:MAG: F0F1 ATP synthase subunit B [Eggerthellaceae bacterium]|nr:F0F1 ATP synthase subunit B [Eggerthellaceae bacterium]
MVKALAVVSSAFAVICALPSLAFAEEKSGVAVILPDMNEFIPMLIAFIIVLIILAKFGWPVFDGIVKKRDSQIKQQLEESEAARIESERLLAEYRQQLADAKKESYQIVAEAKQAGEALKADITAKAQAEADNMIAKAKLAIETEKKAAVAELQESVVDLSCDVAARLVSSDLSDKEHRAIIERYVNEAGSFNAK